MLQALLFDLDGTLVETNSVHHKAWVDVLKPYGYDVTWDFYREKISGRLSPEIFSDLIPNLSPEEVRKMAGVKEASFRERSGSLEPLPGLLDLMEKSQREGIRASLVTNAPKENVLAVLRALKLEDAFDPVILADEVGVGKPDPAPYTAALASIGVYAEEALAFEDSPSGIASSTAAGIPTVGVASTYEPGELRSLGADPIIYDFTDPELLALIEGR
jgi:HAD superfamily hydrolase (TIGR01509 family)